MKEWEKIARSLPHGRSTRIECCRKDRSCIISHTDKGYSKYCFRCGDDSREFVPHAGLTLKEMIQRHQNGIDYMNQEALELPDDFTKDIPAIGVLWLSQAGVHCSVAEHYGIGWSDKLQRVVIPVMEDGKLIAVQSRAVHDWQKPKYMNKTGGKSNALFMSDTDLIRGSVPDAVVLTEDVMSAIRVGLFVPTRSTLGTSINKIIAPKILEFTNNVIIWYDGDAAGIRGARKVKKIFELQGANVRVIRTEKDPKKYCNEEIKNILTREE